ncbi:MAG: F0F1 ATP synthase subunit B [bacterium]
MRTLRNAVALLSLAATTAGAEEVKKSLLEPSYGLMVWTLLIFVILVFVLAKYAFGPITAAVEARELALEEAIEGAKRDREAAAKLLAEHRAALDASRDEAQKIIADARLAGDRVRTELVAQAQAEQANMLARARQEIEGEKTRAIAELRREAVDLAILGAGKVIEKNLDDAGNRQLVESFLSSVTASAVTASR